MKKCIALLLAALLLAAPLAVPVTAAEEASPKEEVVYVNLNADGSVDEINVVNIFSLEKSGTVVDHGDYTSLRNMTSTEALQYENGTVTETSRRFRSFRRKSIASTAPAITHRAAAK